jgi:hypothetical protein
VYLSHRILESNVPLPATNSYKKKFRQVKNPDHHKNKAIMKQKPTLKPALELDQTIDPHCSTECQTMKQRSKIYEPKMCRLKQKEEKKKSSLAIHGIISTYLLRTKDSERERRPHALPG